MQVSGYGFSAKQGVAPVQKISARLALMVPKHQRLKAVHGGNMNYAKHLPLFTTLILAAGFSSTEAAEGTVEFFNESGGYGYVTDNETDESYIFETADISGSVREGDAVTYEVTTEDDRFSVKAQAVALVDAADPQDASPDENDAENAAEDAETADDEAVDDETDDSDDQAADAEEAADEEAESEDGSDESADDGSE
jgi:cold shock CspA family protein